MTELDSELYNQKVDEMFKGLDVDDRYFEENYDDDQLLIHYRSHYRCAVVNWQISQDMILELRAEVKELKERLKSQ